MNYSFLLIITIIIFIIIFKIYNKKRIETLKVCSLMKKLNNNVMQIFGYILDHKEEFNKFELDSFKRMIKNYHIDKMIPTIPLPFSNSTSYTINKGEETSLCIHANDNTLHSENTLMYVLLHELAHMGIDKKLSNNNIPTYRDIQNFETMLQKDIINYYKKYGSQGYSSGGHCIYFWYIYKKLCQIALNNGYITYYNFEKYPVRYCMNNIVIDQNVLDFDF